MTHSSPLTAARWDSSALCDSHVTVKDLHSLQGSKRFRHLENVPQIPYGSFIGGRFMLVSVTGCEEAVSLFFFSCCEPISRWCLSHPLTITKSKRFITRLGIRQKTRQKDRRTVIKPRAILSHAGNSVSRLPFIVITKYLRLVTL